MNNLLYIRELFINNFCISIKAIQIKKFILKDSIFFYLFRLIPFYFIKKCINFNYIYLLDNIYFSNYSNSYSIKPIFISFELSNNDEIISIKENIKKYNLSIPLWFLLYNEKFENYKNFKIKFISKGTMITKEGCIDDYKNKLLEDLFET